MTDTPNDVQIHTYKVNFKPGQVFEWKLCFGVLAPLQKWELPSHIVEALLKEKLGQEINLYLTDVQIGRVIVLGNAPTGDPNTQYVILTDVRWYWTREWLVRNANIKREIGPVRIVGTDGSTTSDGTTIAPTVRYAPWSLDPKGAPWTSEKLLSTAMTASAQAGKHKPYVTWVHDKVSHATPSVVLQEMVVDDRLPVGIAKALSGVPGLDIYVDRFGLVHVGDRMPGAEATFCSKLPPELEEHGSLTKLNLAAERSENYHILFDPEYEVLFYNRPTSGTTGLEDRWMENVVISPDISLTVSGRSGASAVVAQGSYLVHATEAYPSWGNPPTGSIGATKGMGPLTSDKVRKAYLNSFLENNYVKIATGSDPYWGPRVGATKATFRVLWRINPRFMARCLSIRPVLSSIWDEATGTRAPSPIYMDCTRRWKTPWLAASGTGNVQAVKSWAAGRATSVPAPFDVELVDGQQGVILFSPRRDVTGRTDELVPSALEYLPNMNPGESAAAGLGMRPLLFELCVLVADSVFHASTILSCVPAAPNDERRLYEITVSAKDAFALIGFKPPDPGTTSTGTGTNPRDMGGGKIGDITALGPDMFLRWRLSRARFSWPDDSGQQAEIMRVFGADGSDPSQPDAAPTTLSPSNYADEVVPAAKAMAAASLWTKLDHYEGAQAVQTCCEWMVPIGSVTAITFRVAEFFAVTHVSAPPPDPQIDPLVFLPPSTRKLLLKMAAA